jgi:hypothetical protein
MGQQVIVHYPEIFMHHLITMETFPKSGSKLFLHCTHNNSWNVADAMVFQSNLKAVPSYWSGNLSWPSQFSNMSKFRSTVKCTNVLLPVFLLNQNCDRLLSYIKHYLSTLLLMKCVMNRT